MIEKSVAAVVVDKKMRYLLLHPIKGEVKWVLPGGHQKEGETDFQTLAREVEEETGIKKFELVEGFSETNSYINSKGNERVIVVYLIRVESDRVELISKEHDEYKWVEYSDAMTMLNHDKWRAILNKAHLIISGENA